MKFNFLSYVVGTLHNSSRNSNISLTWKLIEMEVIKVRHYILTESETLKLRPSRQDSRTFQATLLHVRT